MGRYRILFHCLVAAMPALAFAQSNRITKSHITSGGFDYWRKGAHGAVLGAVGSKVSPVDGGSFFDPQVLPPATPMAVKMVEVIELTQKERALFEVKPRRGNSTIIGPYKSHAIHLSLQMTGEHGLSDFVNHQNVIKNTLRALEEKARIVSDIWILVDDVDPEARCYSGEIRYSGSKGMLLDVGVNAEFCANKTYNISRDLVIAYSLAKPDEWKKDALVTEPTCSEGWSYEISKNILKPRDRCFRQVDKIVGNIVCKTNLIDKIDKQTWTIVATERQDYCRSDKSNGKTRETKCEGKDFSYVILKGPDRCEKSIRNYLNPTCPQGWKYQSRDLRTDGIDRCVVFGAKKFTRDYASRGKR